MSKKVGFDKWDRQLNNWESSEYYYSPEDEDYDDNDIEEEDEYESRKRS